MKNLLLGLPATEEEIAAVEQDPTALRGMVDAWFVRPEAQAKLGTFFSKAFQQTQISQNDFFDQLSVDNLTNLPLFTQAQESMSRTALKMIADGKPFTDTVTTHTFMMTPTLMSLYLALDQAQVDDAGKQTLSVPMPDGTLSTTQAFWLTYQPPLDPAAMPVVPNNIPLTETLDPASPNFMHFAVPSPFKCSMPQLDDTGHVLLDDKGNAMKADVAYNQRKYSSVSAAFLGLFGYATAQLRERSVGPEWPADADHPRRRAGGKEEPLPIQLQRRRRLHLAEHHRPRRDLAPGHRARGESRREADTVLRSAHAAQRRTRSSCAPRAWVTSPRLRSSPTGRRTTATSTATRSTKR